MHGTLITYAIYCMVPIKAPILSLCASLLIISFLHESSCKLQKTKILTLFYLKLEKDIGQSSPIYVCVLDAHEKSYHIPVCYVHLDMYPFFLVKIDIKFVVAWYRATCCLHFWAMWLVYTSVMHSRHPPYCLLIALKELSWHGTQKKD